jgi:hypothetical protein
MATLYISSWFRKAHELIETSGISKVTEKTFDLWGYINFAQIYFLICTYE